MKKLMIIGALSALCAVCFIGCAHNRWFGRKNTAIQKDVSMTKMLLVPGLEYEVLQEGTGSQPKKGQTVVVHYTGWLNNNGVPAEQFDSSLDRGQPFKFIIGIGYVIEGWDKGVMTMKVGEKRRLFISSVLGYGSRGAGNVIPPNADLIFDVELLAIE